MAELYTKHHKRAVFPNGRQREFLEKVKSKLNLTLKEVAEIADVHIRTLTDWKREKYSISLSALERLCKRTETPLPKDIEIRDPFWYTLKGASAGGIAAYKKYGYVACDPEYRKKRWHEWWEKEGKYRKHPIINVCLPISRPTKSLKLAEFIGIVLGDGCITKRQISVTMHKLDDRDFCFYVRELIKALFSVEPSMTERKNVNIILVSRIKLVSYLKDNGLHIGSKVKNQVDVPLWIKESADYTKHCLRGLFDTDGCFYIDRHNYKGKIYYHCGMNFTNRSLPILYFFKNGLKELGLNPTQKTKFSIFLRRERDIIRYFREIGSSNPKHYNKFKNYFKNKYGEVSKWS